MGVRQSVVGRAGPTEAEKRIANEVFDLLLNIGRCKVVLRAKAVVDRAKERAEIEAALSAGAHHSAALLDAGGAKFTGYNNQEQAPPEVVEGEFLKVSAGFHSAALCRDKSIRCWG